MTQVVMATVVTTIRWTLEAGGLIVVVVTALNVVPNMQKAQPLGNVQVVTIICGFAPLRGRVVGLATTVPALWVLGGTKILTIVGMTQPQTIITVILSFAILQKIASYFSI